MTINNYCSIGSWWRLTSASEKAKKDKPSRDGPGEHEEDVNENEKDTRHIIQRKTIESADKDKTELEAEYFNRSIHPDQREELSVSRR